MGVPGKVRIIGGKWRGRKLQVPNLPGLRPTKDSIRETLFNWLADYIVQANCLDLFAGSGALGFEALSRGAAYVELIDQSKLVVKTLESELINFKADNAKIYVANVPKGLKFPSKKFDIVFLDPPFAIENLLSECIFYLEQNNFLAEKAYIYLESNFLISAEQLPMNWKIVKSKKAGQVFYQLALRLAP